VPPLSRSRHSELNYHYEEGAAWLAESDAGAHSTLIAYAAFEFRLGLERLAAEYWRRLKGDSITVDDLADLRSFKTIENRIFELGGHQLQIERRFAFGQILLNLLALPIRLSPPRLGELAKHWHTCSEMCHVGWSLQMAHAHGVGGSAAHDALQETKALIREHLDGVVTWMRVVDLPFRALEQKYVDGLLSEEEVRAHLEREGIWASVVLPDGGRESVGVPIPPKLEN
jgi:hypothetical protein